MHQLDLDRNVYEGKYSIEMKKKKIFFLKERVETYRAVTMPEQQE